MASASGFRGREIYDGQRHRLRGSQMPLFVMSPLPSSFPPQFRIHAAPLFSPTSKHLSVSTSLGKTTRLTPRTASPRDGERKEESYTLPAHSIPPSNHGPCQRRKLFQSPRRPERDRKQLEQHISTLHCLRPPPLHLLLHYVSRRSFLHRIDSGCIEVRNMKREGRDNNGRKRE